MVRGQAEQPGEAMERQGRDAEAPDRETSAARRGGVDWIDDVVVAAQTLTRLPLRRRVAWGPETAARSVRAYPLIGLGTGFVGSLILALSASIGWPSAIAVPLALAATALVTGALHEDGLADSADGFFGGRDRLGKLAIMRDSRIGSFGVLALIFVIAIRIAALSSLPLGPAAALFTASEILSRAAPATLMLLPRARIDGLAAAFVAPRLLWVLQGWAIAATLAMLLLGPMPVLLALPLMLAALLIGARATLAQIGGITGDVLGAAQQLAVVLLLLLWLPLLGRVS